MNGASPETAELVVAGGAHVPGLLRAIEDRLLSEAGAHAEPLAGHAQDTIAAGGKRLRPLLVLLSAAAPAAPEQTDALVRAGVAVELLHSATLVHDDVLDASALRRGRATVLAAAGRDAAVATGDALLARAFAVLAAPGDPAPVSVLSAASSALAEGELLQRADAWSPGIPVDRYLLRCELKTARLFEAACRLGPLATGEPALDLGAFGRRIGLAFQILDDVLDVSGQAEVTGKPRGADLLDGTVTLPLILARERDRELAAIDLRTVDTPERSADVCAMIEATGALSDARKRALTLVAQAKDALDPRRLGETRAVALALVADSVVERYR